MARNGIFGFAILASLLCALKVPRRVLTFDRKSWGAWQREKVFLSEVKYEVRMFLFFPSAKPSKSRRICLAPGDVSQLHLTKSGTFVLGLRLELVTQNCFAKTRRMSKIHFFKIRDSF